MAQAVSYLRVSTGKQGKNGLGIEAQREAADRFAEKNIKPIIAAIQATGVTTLQGIAEALNTRWVRTARGGTRHAKTVANILGRG
jgi:DNA invertase Pin-like site-specific DNA recombinase